jgi:hypothetical protein
VLTDIETLKEVVRSEIRDKLTVEVHTKYTHCEGKVLVVCVLFDDETISKSTVTLSEIKDWD